MTRPSPFGRLARILGPLLAAAMMATSCRLPRFDLSIDPPPLAQNSVVYAADGTVLTVLHAEQDRVILPYEKIPRVVQDAVVAVEDQRFWYHRGIDLRALLRAAYVNASEGRVVEGGSTITQQFVKNRLVGSDRTLNRKIREAAISWKLEEQMTKQEILAEYLNTIYFGRGAYGLQAAARKYFSKPAEDLALHEAALLAGLISAPERYDPLENPDAGMVRRNLVLRAMLTQELITQAAFKEASSADLGLDPPDEKRRYPAAHFVEYVKKQILRDERFGATQQERYDALFKGGLRIHTTIDLKLQKAAEKAVYGILSQRGDPYGALTAIDPRTGHIVAMVGGRDFFAKPKKDRVARVNLATGDGGTGRQAGSSFKPFALVAGLEQGISPQKTYRGGTSLAIPLAYGQTWNVQNYEGSAYGTLSLEDATINSVNVVYAQLIMEVGAKDVVHTAKAMGIRSRLRAVPSAVLGANEVNTLEMASAYGTLAAGGLRVPPVAIERVTDAGGRLLYSARPEPREVVSPAVAWVVTQILRKVILYGTGISANIGRPAAGKTGTAQQWRDAWFVGFIPQLVAGVWVGFPRAAISMVPPKTRLRVTGGSFPAQIWHAFMMKATRDMPVQNFEKPRATQVSVAVDTARGCLADELSLPGDIETITFVAGTQPKRCRDGSVVNGVPQSGVGVPTVVGMPVDAAVSLLVEKGYTTSSEEEYHAGYPQGTVIRQYPVGGIAAPSGTRVHLVVSTQAKPYVVVPKVKGLAQAQARAKLEAAGFAVAILTASSMKAGYGPGIVVSQSPKGGSERPEGSTVTITVNPSASPAPSPT